MTSQETSATRIEHARHARHLTQADLAGMAGVDVRSIRRLEAGIRVSANTMRAVCAALQIDAAVLIPTDPADDRPVTPPPPAAEILTPTRAALYQHILKDRQKDSYGRSFKDGGTVLTLMSIVLNLANVFWGMAILSHIIQHTHLAEKDMKSLSILLIMLIIISFSFTVLEGAMTLQTLTQPLGRRQVTSFLRKCIWTFGSFSTPLCWTAAAMFSPPSVPFYVLCGLGFVLPRSIPLILMVLYTHEEDQMCAEAQNRLETLIQQPMGSEAEIAQVAAHAEATMDTYTSTHAASVFAPLVWLGQDVAIGMTSPTSAPIYVEIASETAQTLTQSKVYADTVEARKTPSSDLYPISQRFKSLQKKAVDYIQQQYG